MFNRTPVPGPQPSPSPTAPPAGEARRIDSRHLLAGGKELVIEHAGQRYHLRLTRNDKLILTK
ncbi:MAG: hemin uptake protein HemP [Xanthomonadales bacterium]|nr:hemin uptake protein HemP [Xanthomonadales bacterium]